MPPGEEKPGPREKGGPHSTRHPYYLSPSQTWVRIRSRHPGTSFPTFPINTQLGRRLSLLLCSRDWGYPQALAD